MNQAKQHELNIHNHAVEDIIILQKSSEVNLLSVGDSLYFNENYTVNTQMQNIEHQDTLNFDQIDFEEWEVEFEEVCDTSHNLLTPQQRLDKRLLVVSKLPIQLNYKNVFMAFLPMQKSLKKSLFTKFTIKKSST